MARLEMPVPEQPPSRDPERALALSYAPPASRAGVTALFALDDILAKIVHAARDPLIAQLRLTWWHGALTALDTAPAPAEPVLRALSADVLPRGVSGVRLAGMIDGWEALIEAAPLDPAALGQHAASRGAALFASAGMILGAGKADPLEAAGQGWALVDLSRRLGDDGAAAQAAALAAGPLAQACRVRWSRHVRAPCALAHLARLTLAVPLGAPVPVGSPGRVARLAFHRLTGR